MLSWFNVSPQKLSWDLRACLNSAETCESRNNKHSVNQLFSFTFLVNQEFLFSKKISRFVWVHSELFLSLRCLRKWRDWNWNYWTNFPKSLIFDSMEYQNIKMSRKCQARTSSVTAGVQELKKVMGISWSIPTKRPIDLGSMQ